MKEKIKEWWKAVVKFFTYQGDGIPPYPPFIP